MPAENFNTKLKTEEKQRTIRQNGSLHQYGTDLAKQLNNAGYDQKAVLDMFKDGFGVPCSLHFIKGICREVGRVMFGKESTAKLTTVEMMEVYKVVDARFSEVTGIHIEWPSRESLMIQSYVVDADA